MNTKVYLAGPIDRVHLRSAKAWREQLRIILERLNIEVVNPLDKYGKDIKKIRRNLRRWHKEGNVDKIREFVSKNIIDKDIHAVQNIDFLIAYVPYKKGICGTYGEVTIAYKHNKPVYVITDRTIQQCPKWLIGCSTKIFYNFEELIKYLEKNM